MKESIESILKTSTKKPKLFESHDGKEFATKISTDSLNKNSTGKYSR